ncbi:hypothetical protein TNCV_973731 [Trichonephila clavipes]|nr:hypothetical protein TNCV_973731 [Trichonephila clavipes]
MTCQPRSDILASRLPRPAMVRSLCFSAKESDIERKGGAAIEGRGKDREKEGGSEQNIKKSTRWRSERTWQNERDSDYVEEDRNKMALTT